MESFALRRFTELAERAVVALEKLGEDPVVEFETGPPTCPHCGKFNPSVTIDGDAEESGPVVECFFQATCKSCKNTFWAIPLNWVMAKTLEEVKAEMDERAEKYNEQN